MKSLLPLLLLAVTASATLVCDTNSLCDSVQKCLNGLTCSNIDPNFGIGQCCSDSDLLTTRGLITNYPINPTTIINGAAYTISYAGGAVTYRPVIGASPTSSYGCQDLANPSTGISDCTSRAALCQDSQYFDIMTRQCPKTCGRCGINSGSTYSIYGSTTPLSINGASCVDRVNPKTGISDCTSQAYLCYNTLYQTIMREQCPKTCGFCSGTGYTSTRRYSTITGFSLSSSSSRAPGTCVDQVNPGSGRSDCAALAYLCSRSNYATLMRTQCPRTCGFC